MTKPRAWLAIREGVHYRREAFAAGLAAQGFRVVYGLPPVHEPLLPDDVLVIWNRYGEYHAAASRFEALSRRVLVAENAYLGNEFAGARWYAISRSHHNGLGEWPGHGMPDPDGGARWDSLGVELPPIRSRGGIVLVLPQRGIGEPGVAMPRDWLAKVERELLKAGTPYRVRHHPGQNRTTPPIESVLDGVSHVLTWGSGAALKAHVAGIPVQSRLPGWIGETDNAERGRLEMLRRMIWAQWRLSEIQSGEAFEWLLN